ncbi:hypothetical protein BIV59_06620 [Bacillus sp. MUM 13]|nr:hypothetical protein BIV59_06620 [Bacillus sp. MUM 13]
MADKHKISGIPREGIMMANLTILKNHKAKTIRLSALKGLERLCGSADHFLENIENKAAYFYRLSIPKLYFYIL